MSASQAGLAQRESLADLEPLLRPRSVAVIGASPRRRAVTGRFITELVRHGFPGRVVGVNPSHREIFGLPCFASILKASADAAVDLAVIALAREKVEDELRACHEAGVRSVMIFSSGFSETGDEGREVEHRVREFATTMGMRVLGPNTAGFMNILDSVCLMMSSISLRESLLPGHIGVVAQSGGVAGLVCERAQDAGIGFSRVVNTGNEADVSFGEVLQWLAQDDETTVVAGFIEGVREPASFRAGLEALSTAGKPVVMLTSGGTAASARATSAHTGALARSADVLETLFARYGVVHVHGFDDLIDTAACLERGGTVLGRRVGIVTTSGGVGTFSTEAAERAGLEVPELGEETKALLRDSAPAFAGLSNPIDMTAMFQDDLTIFSSCLQAFSRGGEIDVPVLAIAVHSSEFAFKLFDEMMRYRDECVTNDVPLPIVLWPAGEMSAEARRRLRSEGFVVIEDPNRCMRSIAGLRQASVARAERARVVLDTPSSRVTGRPSTQWELFEALQTARVPVVDGRLCADAADAYRAADEFGGRVVVKSAAEDLPHKADVGAVVVGVESPDAAGEAHERVAAAAAGAGSTNRQSIVQRMAPDGFELMVGARRDPDFGFVLVVAPGGFAVELTNDVARRLLPLRAGEAEEMLRELRVFPLLDGYRGTPPCDVGAAVKAIESFAQFVGLRDDVLAAELNPLIVHEAGTGATAVDALIEYLSEPEPG
jgi:acyl-CoA synthetase (NDP forming)